MTALHHIEFIATKRVGFYAVSELAYQGRMLLDADEFENLA